MRTRRPSRHLVHGPQRLRDRAARRVPPDEQLGARPALRDLGRLPLAGDEVGPRDDDDRREKGLVVRRKVEPGPQLDEPGTLDPRGAAARTEPLARRSCVRPRASMLWAACSKSTSGEGDVVAARRRREIERPREPSLAQRLVGGELVALRVNEMRMRAVIRAAPIPTPCSRTPKAGTPWGTGLR
ncbi:hypothetical protein [Sanguibacter massiliensis]|uniref:hypothetical protein n=1 Tax=Sanguibacter massiliensis TaxID=1973217 RepID=UPI000C84DA6E|nr:hypothetical protein [Sanguibacter massiliensis]